MMRRFCLCLCLALVLLCMSAATAELAIDFDANRVKANTGVKGIGAWNADQTVFESYNGELYVAFKDVVYGTKYRVALFVPSAEGVMHSHYATYEFIPDWPYLEMNNMISASTGKYENVTLVVSGNGEVKVMNIQPADAPMGAAERAITMAPELIEQIKKLFQKDKKETNE